MYEQMIKVLCPGLIVFLIDDSGSMADNLPGTSDAKCQWTERLFGIDLKELLARSTQLKGDEVAIKPRYYVLVILYGDRIKIWGDGIMDIATAVEKYSASNNTLGLGGNLCGTDAKLGAQKAFGFLKKAVVDERFKNSFPPMVFHLTDGMSQTDARPVMDEIKSLQVADGAPLIVNAFIGTETNLNYTGPEDFLGYLEVSETGNEDNKRLFEMSSEIPITMHQNLIENGIFPKIREGSRLFFDVRTKEMFIHVMQVVGSMESRAERLVR